MSGTKKGRSQAEIAKGLATVNDELEGKQVDTLSLAEDLFRQLRANIIDAATNGCTTVPPKEAMFDGDRTLSVEELINYNKAYIDWLEEHFYRNQAVTPGLHAVIRRIDDGWEPIFSPRTAEPEKNGFWYKMGPDNKVSGVEPMTPDEYWAYKAAMTEETVTEG